MATNRLEKSEEMATTLPYVLKVIKELCPEGVAYTNSVVSGGIDLSNELDRFYNGAFVCDYGLYPFLKVREFHYDKAWRTVDRIIVESRFDIELFNEWMDNLSISSKVRDMIKSEVTVYYRFFIQKGKLDLAYLDVMKHLINSFKALNKGYELAQCELQELYKTPVGFNRYVSLNYYLTLSYLTKNVKRFNKKQGASSGKYLSVLRNETSNDAVIVNCEKYNKK